MIIFKSIALALFSWSFSLALTIFGGYFIFAYQGPATMDQYEWVANLFHYLASMSLILLGCQIFKLRFTVALISLLLIIIIERFLLPLI
jgi:hypothetical protein